MSVHWLTKVVLIVALVSSQALYAGHSWQHDTTSAGTKV